MYFTYTSIKVIIYKMEKKLILKKRVIRVTFKTGESNVFSNI